MRGAFIVFEGPEGGGKSLQANRLADSLRASGYPVLVTREPGGTRVGESIRSVLLGLHDYAILAETEVLLMAAARAQHVREVILPAQARGQIVLCDRFVDSTYAYQGGGRRLGFEALAAIQRFATDGLEPDLKLLLDVPVDVGLRRRHVDPSSLNRIDLADNDFHERVRQAYIELSLQQPDQWVVVDASETPDDVARSIWAAVSSKLGLRSGLAKTLDRDETTIAGNGTRRVQKAAGDRLSDGT